jgi:hypothetical protein
MLNCPCLEGNDMKPRSNRTRVSLQQAVALLIQNEAALLASQSEANRRFVRIERDLEQIKSLLMRHEQLLSQLPEVIRQKIGFKSK